MSGRRRQPLEPNLFPFLAVLICTLGTLILLLALVAQNAGDAIAAATSPTQSPEEIEHQKQLVEADEAIDSKLSEATWHRDSVVKMRDKQTAQIDERRTRQTHLEDHIGRLREELQRIEAEVAATQDETTKSSSSQEQIATLKAKIEDEKLKIDKLKADQQNMAPRIVIVPHKGPNGTDRRPIYIECKADGIYVQPGDIAIAAKYLDNNIPGPNPLDAALKTIRLYAMKNYGDVDAPYPLIVVRPDGIETYAAARHAMRGWDDQYGYELVPNEVKLAYPEPDPAMNEQVDRAIAQAVRSQQAYANGNRNGDGNRGGGGGGGSTAQYDRGGTQRSGAANGTQYANGNFQGGAQSGSQTELTNGRTGTKRAEDLPALSARNMDVAAAEALKLQGRGSGYGSGNRASFAAQQNAEQRAAAEASEAAAANNAKWENAANNFSKTPFGQADPLASTDAGSMARSTGDEIVGSGKAGETSNADRFAPVSDVASKSNRASASSDPNAPVGGNQAMGNMGDNNPAAANSPPPDPNANTNDPNQGSKTPTVQMNANGQAPSSRRVKRDGKDWALPPDVAAMVGTSMVRTIRVECFADRLVLLPEGGKGATNIYGFTDGDINRATLELATAIRDRVDRWGAGMPGGRWSPLLEVDVAPGGELRFQQLQRLLSGSGVDVQAKGTNR